MSRRREESIEGESGEQVLQLATEGDPSMDVGSTAQVAPSHVEGDLFQVGDKLSPSFVGSGVAVEAGEDLLGQVLCLIDIVGKGAEKTADPRAVAAYELRKGGGIAAHHSLD